MPVATYARARLRLAARRGLALLSAPWPSTISAGASTSSTTRSSRLLDERARVVADVGARQARRQPPHVRPGARAPHARPPRGARGALPARGHPRRLPRGDERLPGAAGAARRSPTSGPEGTFSHAAAQALLRPRGDVHRGDDLRGRLRRGGAARGRSTGSSRSRTRARAPSTTRVDALVDGDLLIRAELELEVSQCLLTRASGLAVDRARLLASAAPRAVPASGSRRTSRGAQLVQSPSTAAAVREAADDPRRRRHREPARLGALRRAHHARAHPGPRRELHPLRHASRTRTPPGRATTRRPSPSACATVAGRLLRVLAVLDEEGINLTRIESRPSREKPWDYVFLADLVGPPRRRERRPRDGAPRASTARWSSTSGAIREARTQP